MDDQGSLRVYGRLGEVIIRGGEDIFRESEDVIGSDPAVAAVAVVGLPGPVHGEQVATCGELAPGGSADAAGLRALREQDIVRNGARAPWAPGHRTPAPAMTGCPAAGDYRECAGPGGPGARSAQDGGNEGLGDPPLPLAGCPAALGGGFEVDLNALRAEEDVRGPVGTQARPQRVCGG
jgi:hypothetical protein